MTTAIDFFSKTESKKLAEGLAEANGRATARTLSADACAEYLERYMQHLDITKRALTGTVATVHATMERLPHAYKYRADSTKATFEFDGKVWRFVFACRDRLVQRGNACHVEARLSASAVAALADKYELV